jgi:hypothetical protein
MDNLSGKISESHVYLLSALDLIRQNIRSYAVAKPHLKNLQNLLLNHFEKQSKILYEELITFYSNDREKSKLLEFLTHDLKEFKIKTLVFFDAHSADMGDLKPKGIIPEFEEFSHFIIGRMHHEKKYLIPMVREMEAASQ